MLEQPWMDSAQSLGRIKVVIAEGINPTPSSAFQKIRNIVAFAFIHAPQGKFWLSSLDSVAECYPQNF